MPTEAKSPQTYTIIVTRHGESESNVPDNSGVNKMDPLLTTEDTRRDWPCPPRLGLSGRDFCNQVTRREYQDMFNSPGISRVTYDSPVVISSLSRAIQTAIIALPAGRLQKPGIVLSPLIVEQTTWFSDRTRPVSHLARLVEKELRIRHGLTEPVQGLDGFDIRQLLQPAPAESCLVGAMFGELAVSTGPKLETSELMAVRVEEADKPWHLKSSLWHPRQLIRRGEEAIKMIMTIGRHIYIDENSTPAIIVFGHGGFVNYMTEDTGLTEEHVGQDPPVLTDWEPGETRMFKLVDRHPDQPVVASLLKETHESRKAHQQRKVAGAVEQPSPRGDVKSGRLMREQLQAKIVEIDRQYQNLDIYQRAHEKNPDEVEGNHMGYAEHIIQDFKTRSQT
ncbi:hypothetical protein MN608_03695 [Microdochium nivale]|nr:hypothetical protein MN608_03695 [Microdochium nivale]